MGDEFCVGRLYMKNYEISQTGDFLELNKNCEKNFRGISMFYENNIPHEECDVGDSTLSGLAKHPAPGKQFL